MAFRRYFSAPRFFGLVRKSRARGHHPSSVGGLGQTPPALPQWTLSVWKGGGSINGVPHSHHAAALLSQPRYIALVGLSRSHPPATRPACVVTMGAAGSRSQRARRGWLRGAARSRLVATRHRASSSTSETAPRWTITRRRARSRRRWTTRRRVTRRCSGGTWTTRALEVCVRTRAPTGARVPDQGRQGGVLSHGVGEGGAGVARVWSCAGVVRVKSSWPPPCCPTGTAALPLGRGVGLIPGGEDSTAGASRSSDGVGPCRSLCAESAGEEVPVGRDGIAAAMLGNPLYCCVYVQYVRARLVIECRLVGGEQQGSNPRPRRRGGH